MLHSLSSEQRADSRGMRAESMIKVFRLLYVRTMAINCLQRRGIIDGQRVGREAHDRAVAGVQAPEM
jgi:hypothetical protein